MRWFFGENIVNSVWRKTGQNFCLWRKVANIIRVVYEEEGGSRLRMQKVGGRLEKPMAHPAEVQIIIVSIIFIK